MGGLILFYLSIRQIEIRHFLFLYQTKRKELFSICILEKFKFAGLYLSSRQIKQIYPWPFYLSMIQTWAVFEDKRFSFVGMHPMSICVSMEKRSSVKMDGWMNGYGGGGNFVLFVYQTNRNQAFSISLLDKKKLTVFYLSI